MRFIKEKSINIIFSIVLLLVINIYLISINSFNGRTSDLIYLDFIIITIYLIWIYIAYFNWKKKYYDLYKSILNENDISLEDIKESSLEEEIIFKLIDNKDKKYDFKTKEYEEKLRDMEEYISKWVHEIKLPITALNIITEDIEDYDAASIIKNETEKINFLVNSVIYGSRATVASEDIFIKEENLGDIVKKSIRNNSFFLIKNKIEIATSNLNYNIYSDGKWIIYVIDQLINNAIKYSKENGKIEFYAEDNREYIKLCIKDNGIGIEKEDIERIFNKGFTGSNGRNKVYKSTGMGLYFTKKVLNKLEHEISVESIKGEHTLFNIYFYKISDYLKVTKM
ncbi:sensor histidine kinase [Clostridium tertium]|uniref:sensor histidine kinase n=1 Tax=Clostridium tertium TaxID=1559 RepID=UPI0024B36204|nr:ATP-binding protein [Clostridium tertium]MDI9218209.1 ATP-binding protein [Clostridium tertium]